ncbi:MAG: HAMP domain-containing sensor histidine kinase [Luteolibacter sp.]
MKNRNCWVWIAFACCACLVLGAMLWLTRSVIHTERDRALAEIRAEIQERTRLSLWRMDSLGASLLLEENSVPPQLFLSEPETRLPETARFETPDGAAITGTGDKAALNRVGAMLPTLISGLKTDDSPKLAEKTATKDENTPLPVQGKIRGDIEAQAAANIAEKANREKWVGDAISRQKQNYATEEDAGAATPEPTPSAREISNPIGEFRPTWFGDSLFLIRRGMTITNFAQGILIDTEGLKKLLLTEAAQLLPNATLAESIKPSDVRDDSFVLASFPFKLVPGTLGESPESIPRTISASLLAGWLAAFVALLAAYFLIANVMKLSERRASFVSAVTHELRTPLTTFRLYSDMLSSGAVREEKRPAYLGVLSREADRLSHLVENVLAFSKIERGNARSNVSEIELCETLENFRERFESRLDAAGLSLNLVPCQGIRTTLDTSALEHILFNLIDNAAKYAAASEPPVVTLEATQSDANILIRISDNGPGIAASERARIFQAFHKSAEQAATTQPGVGLGLALSKRLTRSMGGKLTCQSKPDGTSGATFTLTLPRV